MTRGSPTASKPDSRNENTDRWIPRLRRGVVDKAIEVKKIAIEIVDDILNFPKLFIPITVVIKAVFFFVLLLCCIHCSLDY